MALTFKFIKKIFSHGFEWNFSQLLSVKYVMKKKVWILILDFEKKNKN